MIDIKCEEVSRRIIVSQQQKDALIMESGKIKLGAVDEVFSVLMKSNNEDS